MDSKEESSIITEVKSMTIDNILDDLLRRRPKGPPGKNITYVAVQGNQWCPKKGVYKSLTKSSVHQFGYTDDELFKLGFMNRNEVDFYLRARDFEGKSDYRLGRKKSTLTRRINLVWGRIESAVFRVTREGRVGIYSIKQIYGNEPIGHVYARSMEEAKESARLFFGYLAPENEWFRLTFVKIGKVSEISALNDKITSTITSQISAYKESIESFKEHISKLEATLTTLNTVERQQIAVETVYALNNID